MSELTCPKCHGAMRSYERSGITVDQCLECRGIFLDRGELERLVDAENAWASQGAPAAPPVEAAPRSQAPPAPPQDYYGDKPSGYYGGKPPKKRKSFLEELFD